MDPFSSIRITKPGPSRSYNSTKDEDENDPFAAIKITKPAPATGRRPAPTLPGMDRIGLPQGPSDGVNPFEPVRPTRVPGVGPRMQQELPEIATTAPAPSPIERALAQVAMQGTRKTDIFGAKELTPAQQQQAQRARVARQMADVGGELGVQTAGGALDAVLNAVQGVGELADIALPGDPGIGEALGRSRAFVSERLVGQPETMAGMAGRGVGYLGGTLATYLMPAAAAARAAGAAGGTSRALNFLANPIGRSGLTVGGNVNRAGQLASGALMTAPVNVAMGLSPDNTAEGFVQLGQMMEGKEGRLAQAAQALGAAAEPFAKSPAGRVAFEFLADFAPNAAILGATGALARTREGVTYMQAARAARAGDVGQTIKLTRELQQMQEAGSLPLFTGRGAEPATEMPAIPSRPTQETIDRAAFTSKLNRALEAGNDAEIARLLERQQQLRPLDEQLEDALDRQANASGKKAKQRADAEVERVLTLMDQQALPMQGPQQWRGPQRFGEEAGTQMPGATPMSAGRPSIAPGAIPSREGALPDERSMMGVGGDAGLALGGGLAGGTQGETEEERMRNAMLMAGTLGGARKLRQAMTAGTPEVKTLMQAMRTGTQQAERRGLVANVELASMKDPRFTGVEQLGEDALELQLGAINGTVEPLAKALNLRMGQDVQAKPSFGLWFGESVSADVQPSVLLEFKPEVDQRKALALVAEYSRIAKQKALFYLAPDDAGTRTALNFVVRDQDGTPIPSNLVLDLLREGRAGWNGAMISDDGTRTVLVLDEKLSPDKIQSELDRIESVVAEAGFQIDPEQARVGRVNAAEIGDKRYLALVNSAGVDRGNWSRAVRTAERLYEGVATTAEKLIAARRIFDRPDANDIELNLEPETLAAVRTPFRRGKPGKVFVGPNHMVANGKAARAGFRQADTEAGYTLTNGEFVNRYEGEAVMELMAERGDDIAAKAVDAVQSREETGAASWLRSEDIFAAGRGGSLERRAERQSQFGREGKVYDIGGALGEGTSALMKTPGGRRLLGNVALGTTGYGLQGADDEKLRETGKGMMALALGSAVYPALKAGVRQGARGIAEQLKQTPRGRYALNLLTRDITTDPAVKQAVEDALAERAQITARFQELAREARALGPTGDRVLSDLIEKEGFAAQELAQMSPDDVATATAVAQRIANQVRELGSRKVEEELISQQTFLKRAESYLPRLYAKYDADGLVEDVAVTHKGKTFRITGEKIRNDNLTPEERDALGEIREASYRLAEAGRRGAQDVSTARLFRTLADMPGVIHPDFKAAKENELMAQLFAKQALKTGDRSAAREALQAVREARAEAKQLAEAYTQPNYAAQWLKKASEGTGYVRLPDTPNMGSLRGAVVRADVADYLHDLPDLASAPGMYRRLLRNWKEIKTVYNVGTQIANVLSNFSVVHAAGIPWWRQAAQFRGAAQDLKNYGPATKALTEAGVMGVNMPGFSDVPVKGVAQDVAALRQLAETTRPETRAALEEQGITPYGKLGKLAKKGQIKAEQAYAAGDGVFRVMLYKKYVKDGMTSDEAIAEVMRNMPSYDTRSPILGALRMGPAPFIMYPAKYLPTVLDNIMMHPYRWATLAGTTWAVMDQASRRLYGEIEEQDLPPNRRSSSTFGYLMPGVTQADFPMRPVMQALGLTPSEDRKYTIDAARFTPLSAMTGTPVPGSDLSSQLLGDRAPQILQPSGPLMDVAALAMGKNAYTGEDFFSPSDEPLDKALKLGGWAYRMATPTFLGVHTPRVIGDIRRGDLDAAFTNALGILGMRPTMVTPGMQSQLQQRRFEEQMSDARLKLRQELRKARTPEEEARIEQKYEAKMNRLAAKYQQRLDEEEE